MTDRAKKGMAALLAEQHQQVASEAAIPAIADRPASAASPSRSATAAGPSGPYIGQPAAAPPAGPSRDRRDGRPGKAARLRSWYMTPATADALSKAVDDLHYSTRAPKYEVLAAIVRAGLASLGAIEEELRAQQSGRS